MLEEAVHLVRLSPIETLGSYYLGTIPFALGFLFFWADMSHDAFAAEHVGRATFALALLFVWMKTWQAIFGDALMAQLAHRAPEPWSWRRAVRMAVTQLIHQPAGLFLLPLGFLMTIPSAWVFAFYQNLSVMGGGNPSTLFKRAGQQSRLFPKQNHLALLILAAFAIFVWINYLTLLLTLPGLMKMLLGIETSFTRGGFHTLFNTTFLSASLILTYLSVDPIIKAFYALRCFYGQALTSGEDLKVELKNQSTLSQVAAIAAGLLISFLPGNIHAQEGSSAKPQTAVSPSQLETAIKQVLERPEFTWRQPREKAPPAETKSWLMQVLESVGETIRDWLRSLRDVLRKIIEWLEKQFRTKDIASQSSSGGEGWMNSLRFLVFLLIALLASALVILFMRMWKHRQREEVVVAQPIAAAPDLMDENISAKDLPEDGWLKLARELINKGEFRLALRALYLAGLAHLAEREFVRIARFKSNREYELEVRRRARAQPDLQNAFGQNVAAFDRSWYGRHEVTREALQNFEMNLERIRAC